MPPSIKDHPVRRQAYGLALSDATRTAISEEELCQFSWRFSFKLPGWFTDELSRFSIVRYFNNNHTVSAPMDDPLWGDAAPRWGVAAAIKGMLR